MQATLFTEVGDCITLCIKANRPVTDYIEGELKDSDIEHIEDSCFFRVEQSRCKKLFRIWILCILHDEGFTGLF